MVAVVAGQLLRFAGQHFMCVAWEYMHLERNLSICFTVRKERAHIPRCNAPENFVSRYGAAHGRAQELTPGSAALFGWKIVRKNHRLVPRQNIAGS